MRRVALRILLFLLIGAVINVAAAWGYVARDGYRATREFKGSADIPQAWPWHAPADWPAPEVMLTREVTGYRVVIVTGGSRLVRPFTEVMTESAHPPKTVPAFTHGPSRMVGHSMMEQRAGWPLHGLASRIDLPSATIVKVETSLRSITLQGTDSFFVKSDSGDAGLLIPFMPRWPAFVINTATFAIGVWFVCQGGSLVRRWLRARRGLCPHCAYIVGTATTCPECGKPVTPPKAGPA